MLCNDVTVRVKVTLERAGSSDMEYAINVPIDAEDCAVLEDMLEGSMTRVLVLENA